MCVRLDGREGFVWQLRISGISGEFNGAIDTEADIIKLEGGRVKWELVGYCQRWKWGKGSYKKERIACMKQASKGIVLKIL